MSVRKKILHQIDPETGAPQEATWWIADYADGSGRRHQVRFKHKRDAVAHEEKSKVAVRDGKYLVVSDVAVADAARIWMSRCEANGMRHRGPVERATLLQYRQHVNLHILPRVGNLKLPKLTRQAIEGFRDALLKDPAMSRAMARKVLVSLKSILKANNCSHLAGDVTIGTDARGKPQLEKGRDFPTPAEISRLIAAAAPDARLNALLRVAALCGLRASELRGLRWFDVDLKAVELHIRQRADRYGAIGAPKTKESQRTIPLSPETVLALKAWKLACPKGELDLVFPSTTGAVEHHKNLARGLAPVMHAAGVVTKDGKPKYTMHAFRHFFASWCINSKASGGRELPAKEAQHLLGHSSIVMTLDRYGHLFPSGGDRSELAASEKALLG
jgi:integrase